MWAPEAERGQGAESHQSSPDKIGKKKHSQSAEMSKLLATRLDGKSARGTGHLQRGVSPSWRAEPQGSVSRPSFVQLTRAGPSLSPADGKAEGQEVTGHGRAPRPGAHRGGAGSSPGNTEFLESSLLY